MKTAYRLLFCILLFGACKTNKELPLIALDAKARNLDSQLTAFRNFSYFHYEHQDGFNYIQFTKHQFRDNDDFSSSYLHTDTIAGIVRVARIEGDCHVSVSYYQNGLLLKHETFFGSGKSIIYFPHDSYTKVVFDYTTSDWCLQFMDKDKTNHFRYLYFRNNRLVKDAASVADSSLTGPISKKYLKQAKAYLFEQEKYIRRLREKGL